MLAKIKQILTKAVGKARTSDDIVMIILPVIIGILGGYGAVLLRFLIHLFQDILWGNEQYQGSWYMIILIPALGAFIVGVIIHFFAQEAKGHGVPEVMEAITLKNGIIRPRVVAGKAVSSALTIASGGSVGREGPIIQIGSAIGSIMGQVLKLSSRRIKTLVGCGAAAGIAAAFNAPIAGAMFSVEVLLGDFTISRFSPIVISSVTATVISRVYYGDHPAFDVPAYVLKNPLELIPYAIMGLLCGVVAILFIKVLSFFEDKFDAIKCPDYYKTVTGGLLLGIVGLKFPEIFGVGYKAMDQALLGSMELHLLGLLVFVKILATSLTLGSGNSGGIFAPSLFMGAMTGGFFGHIVHKLFPSVTAGPGAYSLVAMSALVAATTHAPITAILIIFEMTNDYKIILPLMIATIISLVVTKKQKGSIYTLKLLGKGIDIHKGKEVNLLKSMSVKDYMRSSILTVAPDASIKELIEILVQSDHSYIYIKEENGEINERISQAEISTVAPDYENIKDLIVAGDISTPNLISVRISDNLNSVMKAFASENVGEIPVFSDTTPPEIIGTIWRIDVIDAYNKEILKRDLAGEVSSMINRSGQYRPIEICDGLFLLEVEVPSSFHGKSLRDIDIRNRYQVDVLMIHKNLSGEGQSERFIPRSSYQFSEGDSFLVLGSRKDVEKIGKV